MTEARWKIVHARLVESLCTDGRGTNSPHAHIRWCRVVERCPEVQRRTDQEVADANGLPTGGVVGMGQARGGGQENNLIHTKAESALPHHNPRGSGLVMMEEHFFLRGAVFSAIRRRIGPIIRQTTAL